MLRLSPGEIRFITDGVSENIRADGRDRLDFRPMTIETGLISQANGSARIVLGGTDILIGVKSELGEPLKGQDKGHIEVSVECCPSASPEFEGRGGSALNLELAKVTERFLNASSSLDFKSLSLVPGKQCWILTVDALVLASTGNLFDALSIGIRAALGNTKIPFVSVVQGDSGSFELELDPEKTFALDIENVPICVALTKIGKEYIVDATLEEEFCSDCRIAFAVNQKGNLTTIQKGNGTLSHHQLHRMMLDATVIGKKVIEGMNTTLQQEKSRRTKLGFFA